MQTSIAVKASVVYPVLLAEVFGHTGNFSQPVELGLINMQVCCIQTFTSMIKVYFVK